MATGNNWNNTILDADVTLNGGTVDIGTDNASNNITIGTGTNPRSINIGRSAAAHTVQIGVNNSTSTTDIQAGTGNLTLNSGGTADLSGTSGVTIESTSGALDMGANANTGAINIGTGAAARTITMGNTTTTTATNIDSGSGGITLTTGTNGDIDLSPNGIGTVNISYLTQYTLPVAGASGTVDDLADGLGSSGQVLTSNGAGAEPTWEDSESGVETLTGDSGGAISPTAGGDIVIAGGTNITTAGAGNTITANLDAAISLATSVTSPLYTVASGDLVLNMADDAGTDSVSFTNDSDAEVAFIDSLGAAQFTELDVDNININGNTIISTDTNGDITLTPDGTGVVNLSYLTQYVLPIAGASGAVDDLADGLGSSGEVLTSNGAGAEPTWQAAPAGGGLTWNVATGATQACAVNNGYFANYNGTLAFTLPTTAAVGDTIEVCQMYAGQGWTIAVNSGETIYIGNTNTTITSGTLASSDDGDWVELVCRVANTDWQANVKSGNITVT